LRNADAGFGSVTALRTTHVLSQHIGTNGAGTTKTRKHEEDLARLVFVFVASWLHLFLDIAQRDSLAQ